MRSHNVRFRGDVPPDEALDHPPGVWVARRLTEVVAETGWQTAPFDDWAISEGLQEIRQVWSGYGEAQRHLRSHENDEGISRHTHLQVVAASRILAFQRWISVVAFSNE